MGIVICVGFLDMHQGLPRARGRYDVGDFSEFSGDLKTRDKVERFNIRRLGDRSGRKRIRHKKSDDDNARKKPIQPLETVHEISWTLSECFMEDLVER